MSYQLRHEHILFACYLHVHSHITDLLSLTRVSVLVLGIIAPPLGPRTSECKSKPSTPLGFACLVAATGEGASRPKLYVLEVPKGLLGFRRQGVVLGPGP